MAPRPGIGSSNSSFSSQGSFNNQSTGYQSKATEGVIPVLEGELAIQEAIRMHEEEGISLTKAALRMGQVPSTVTRRASGTTKPAKDAQQSRTKIDRDHEEVLANYCRELQDWGYPMRLRDLRALAEHIYSMPLGINWPQRFLKCKGLTTLLA
jgi:hypothetical protein